MPRASSPPIPFTISAIAPVGVPLDANKILDLGANQISVIIKAVGADVVLAAAAAGTNTLWYYHDKLACWTEYVQQWRPAGATIANTYALDDLQRNPTHALAFHLQATAAVNLGSAEGFIQTIRGGV